MSIFLVAAYKNQKAPEVPVCIRGWRLYPSSLQECMRFGQRASSLGWLLNGVEEWMQFAQFEGNQLTNARARPARSLTFNTVSDP